MEQDSFIGNSATFKCKTYICISNMIEIPFLYQKLSTTLKIALNNTYYSSKILHSMSYEILSQNNKQNKKENSEGVQKWTSLFFKDFFLA